MNANDDDRRAIDAFFQARVGNWVHFTFGPEVAEDVRERAHRFLEEALELAQATGCTENEARMLVDYVFGRPVGNVGQEVGGVSITLTALCNATRINLAEAAEDELKRIWAKAPQIREKHLTKPVGTPLPGTTQG